MSANELHKEVLLVNLSQPGTRIRCWLPSSGLRVGMRLTLKDLDPDVVWKIEELGEIQLPRSALNKEWHVGGL